jgi:hypothetical protein
MPTPNVSLLQLKAALESAWHPDTAYLGVAAAGNPALGQCYPTARLVQFFFPATEIVEGEVWTGVKLEKHFWNILIIGDEHYHIDLAWQQFPPGSIMRNYKIRPRETLGDRPVTVERCRKLRSRVIGHLEP